MVRRTHSTAPHLLSVTNLAQRRPGQRLKADRTMAENIVPHFHNTPGVPVIEIGAKEFMCVGETPPFDKYRLP